MTKHLLALGVCVLALALTSQPARADATIIGPLEEVQEHYALHFPRAQSYAEAVIHGPNPTDLISGWGEAFIRGPGADRNELFARAISGARFLLTERHYYVFEGRVATSLEVGTVAASALLFDPSAGPVHLFEVTGTDSEAFRVEGILEPGEYLVRGSTGMLPDERAQMGYADGAYAFRLTLRPVPEPTSVALLASGGLLLLLRRRRKRD